MPFISLLVPSFGAVLLVLLLPDMSSGRRAWLRLGITVETLAEIVRLLRFVCYARGLASSRCGEPVPFKNSILYCWEGDLHLATCFLLLPGLGCLFAADPGDFVLLFDGHCCPNARTWHRL